VEKRHTWQGTMAKKKAHFMESETSALCGRPLLNTKPLLEDWNPEEHLDCVCPICLEWWRLFVKPCTGTTKHTKERQSNEEAVKV